MPNIQKKRDVYKTPQGFEYPIYFDRFKQATISIWDPMSVSMVSDIKDFIACSPEIKEVIAGILRGFTIMETHVGDYWTQKVAKMFPKHEIVAMCRAFGYFEAIHAWGYNHLSESLGINDFDAFLTDPTVEAKIEYFLKHKSDLVSLAVFSGGAEGIMLFSQFATLLSLSRDGKFKGLAQIVSWSSQDESVHSQAGCDLFNDLVKERGITDEEIVAVYEGIDTVILNEFNFIDQIFKRVDGVYTLSLPFISPTELKDYILIRANYILKYLGLEERYFPNGEGYKVKEWFDNEVYGVSSNDFFHQSVNGQTYSALVSQDFHNFDYSRSITTFKD